ncbi:winged helix-turn-helix transcriptional regulator [Roseateles noduli]|uniref:winged helix-turn-helix transcriptional regulator n=1 Tax=Roseateles noduli TaxID=2052484 RepID=UPI003D65B3DB
MGFLDSGESVCPIAQTLAIVGERWTLLILREMFMGSTRFDEFQMYTEAAPHLLSTRLKQLEVDGIVTRELYQERPPRHEYKLTAKGLDLFPVIMGLKAFGDKHGKYRSRGKAAITVVHAKCGHSTELKMRCSCCDEPYGPMDVLNQLNRAFASEREERKAAFIEKQRGKSRRAPK